MAGFPSGKNKVGNKAKRPRPGIALDKAVLLKLIAQEDGNVSRVADILGTTRHTVKNRCDADPDLQIALRDARERQLDALEKSCFTRAIESQDTTLQLFLLKTQGKSRGYDQDEAKHAAKEVANAAFEFIVSKTKADSK